MNKEKSKHNIIKLEDKLAVSFMPQNEGCPAVVDFDVLKRLVSALPSANIDITKDSMKDKIDECHTMREYIEVLSKEVAYRTAIQKIEDTYQAELAVSMVAVEREALEEEEKEKNKQQL